MSNSYSSSSSSSIRPGRGSRIKLTDDLQLLVQQKCISREEAEQMMSESVGTMVEKKVAAKKKDDGDDGDDDDNGDDAMCMQCNDNEQSLGKIKYF